MFSVCVSLLFVGFAINRLMRPKLKISFSLPMSSPAGEPFPVITHLKNRSRLPAMDFELAFDGKPSPRRRSSSKNGVGNGCHSDPRPVSLIRPKESMDLRGSLEIGQRGIHRLPDVLVTSMFPFHLFRSRRRYCDQTTIAITPRPLDTAEDVLARGLLDSLGQWSRKLLSGDQMDYTGSREYVVGMPVRQWDFTSWARLGRPIVREFQSPSIQTVMLLVDTSIGDPRTPRGCQGEAVVERVLSLAATAIGELSRKMVHITLSVTGEPLSQPVAGGPTRVCADAESLLIRLAAAQHVPAAEADKFIQCVLDQVGRMPVLVLTARSEVPGHDRGPSNLTILRIDPPEQVQKGATRGANRDTAMS
jgi:uncharacterized protein (DUF58 family)